MQRSEAIMLEGAKRILVAERRRRDTLGRMIEEYEQSVGHKTDEELSAQAFLILLHVSTDPVQDALRQISGLLKLEKDARMREEAEEG